MPAAIYLKQVELYMKAQEKGLTQETASAKAGISTRTASRIKSRTHRPNRFRRLPMVWGNTGQLVRFCKPVVHQPLYPRHELGLSDVECAVSHSTFR